MDVEAAALAVSYWGDKFGVGLALDGGERVEELFAIWAEVTEVAPLVLSWICVVEALYCDNGSVVSHPSSGDG